MERPATPASRPPVGVEMGVVMPVTSKCSHNDCGRLESIFDAGASTRTCAISVSATEQPLRYRVVEIRDRNTLRRRSHIEQCVSDASYFRHALDAVDFLQQAVIGFDALLVSGDDERRVLKIIRQVKTVLASKCVIPIVTRSNPKMRADFLRRGADDVFDLNMDPQECCARLASIAKRRALSATTDKDDRELRASLDIKMKGFLLQAATAWERHMLETLLRQAHNTASYDQLCRRPNASWRGCSSKKSLAVAVSRLRSKLKDGFRIECERGFGYRLVQAKAHQDFSELSTR